MTATTGQGTAFYLDPPYWGSEDDYGKAMFTQDKFAELADRLSRLRGRFILSINDVPEIRELFGQFELSPMELGYSISGGPQTVARELLFGGERHDGATTARFIPSRPLRVGGIGGSLFDRHGSAGSACRGTTAHLY